MGKAAKADDDAEQVILEYLNQQNRPYNVQMVFDNLHGKIKKPTVTRSLESLAAQDKISVKKYGAQCIYLANQDQYDIPTSEELLEMDGTISKLTETLNDISSENKTLQNDIKGLNNMMSDEELAAETQRLKEENEKLEKKLDGLRNGAKLLSDAELDVIKNGYISARTTCRKRKSMVIGDILEGWPKSKEELFEEMQIEKEEEFGISFNLKDDPYPQQKRSAIAKKGGLSNIG